MYQVRRTAETKCHGVQKAHGVDGMLTLEADSRHGTIGDLARLLSPCRLLNVF
jgi:hypothetical protein